MPIHKLETDDKVVISDAPSSPILDSKDNLEAALNTSSFVPPVTPQDPLSVQAEQVSKTVDAVKQLALDGTENTNNVEITPEDKTAFLDAIINNSRFVKRFSLYNGRLTGKFRCRTTEENYAITSWIADRMSQSKTVSAVGFSILLRNILLYFQLEELNGVKYPEIDLSEDKHSTSADTKWAACAEAFGKRFSEAILSALFSELQKFEVIYWTLVSNSTNQNFWQPAESA